MSEQDDLRIIDVELVEPSMRTHRVLNNLDPAVYPVLICLSHPADPFEAKFLRENCGIVVDDDDPMTALILETSVDALKAQIAEWNERIALAARQAQQARDAAVAEDQRMMEVAAELHRALSPTS